MSLENSLLKTLEMNASILIELMMAVLFDCMLLSEGAGPIRAEFTKVECVNSVPELVEINCRKNRTFKNTSSLYVDFRLAEDIRNATGLFIVAIKHGSNFDNYTSIELNYCTALQMVHSNFLVQMVTVELRRKSNLPMSCPLKKNILYYVNGFIIDPKVIPSYVPEISFRADMIFIPKTKQIIRFTTYGQVGRKRRIK